MTSLDWTVFALGVSSLVLCAFCVIMSRKKVILRNDHFDWVNKMDKENLI